MKVVCLDTNVLIWGIKEEAEPGQENMIPRAKAFLQYLDENHIPAVIPSVVLAEFLVRTPPENHAEIIQKLEKSFIISMFDVGSSSSFANLWNKKNGIRKEDPVCTRDHMKIDLMVVATAISAGLSSICSSDPHVIKAAEGLINCIDLPPYVAQLPLDMDKQS